jgi:hypothetical protein
MSWSPEGRIEPAELVFLVTRGSDASHELLPSVSNQTYPEVLGAKPLPEMPITVPGGPEVGFKVMLAASAVGIETAKSAIEMHSSASST